MLNYLRSLSVSPCNLFSPLKNRNALIFLLECRPAQLLYSMFLLLVVEGACSQLPAPGPVTAFDIFPPCSPLSAKLCCLWESGVSTVGELCKRHKTTTSRRESWLPEVHGLSLQTDNNLLQGNSHLWRVPGTRYEIPKAGMEPRKKLIISFFSRQHSDTYDKISWANSLPKSKLAIHSVTTVTWISEHRHSSQTVEPWKTHSGVESITN